MGGRDKADHIERTRAGMILARQRGARLGAVKKLSTQQIAQLLDAVRAGTTVAKIAKQFGISTASVNNYAKAKGHTLQELRDEGKSSERLLQTPLRKANLEGRGTKELGHGGISSAAYRRFATATPARPKKGR